MRIFIDNKTGNLCLLTFINSYTGVIKLEYEKFEVKAKVNLKNISAEDLLKKDFTEIGCL